MPRKREVTEAEIQRLCDCRLIVGPAETCPTGICRTRGRRAARKTSFPAWADSAEPDDSALNAPDDDAVDDDAADDDTENDAEPEPAP